MWMPVIWTQDDEYNDNNTSNNKNNSEREMPMDPIDRAFRDFWEDGLQTTHSMKTDVVESDKEYKLSAELPGINKEDIQIDLKNGILTIAASHKENDDEKNEEGKYIRRERRAASYRRSFRLGEEYKPEDISAKYENGVLTLTIPKKGASTDQNPSRVQIQ